MPAAATRRPFALWLPLQIRASSRLLCYAPKPWAYVTPITLMTNGLAQLRCYVILVDAVHDIRKAAPTQNVHGNI